MVQTINQLRLGQISNFQIWSTFDSYPIRFNTSQFLCSILISSNFYSFIYKICQRRENLPASWHKMILLTCSFYYKQLLMIAKIMQGWDSTHPKTLISNLGASQYWQWVIATWKRGTTPSFQHQIDFGNVQHNRFTMVPFDMLISSKVWWLWPSRTPNPLSYCKPKGTNTQSLKPAKHDKY